MILRTETCFISYFMNVTPVFFIVKKRTEDVKKKDEITLSQKNS